METTKPRPPSTLSAEFRDPADIALSGLDGRAFRVWRGGIPYDCYLRLRPGSTRVFVMLHGAISRAMHTPPIFARWDWDKRVNGHILSVSDPTLGFSETVFITWYLGSADRPIIPGLCEVADAVADRLGVEPVYYGSSAGGFGAIAAACHSGGKAIAINPQTDVAAYGKGVASMARLFGSATGEEAKARFADRWMAVNLVKNAVGSPRIVIGQNDTDLEHLDGHLTPFCAELGVPVGGTAGGITTRLFSQPGGHNGKETESTARRLIGLL